ncbi:MAG: succinate-semialdehyde dehydrogenase/glutarate-semialdehyde dehydrogenase [Myxococcota bacterium]|jgi:succinate-semialdehyde dehydrogenase/glutarate-semialdehyde dehydrogenase
MFTSSLIPHAAGYWAGAFQAAPGLPTFEVSDPASGEVLSTLPSYGTRHTELAIAAARNAHRPYPLAQRKAWLEAIGNALRMATPELARLITAENGKPLEESRGEVAYSAGFFDDAASRIHHLETHTLEAQPRDHRWQVHHRSAGVAGLITPWNFPLGMLAKKLAGALAAGCPVVVKPSELTPLSCLGLFTLLDALELPKGMVNLVFGDAVAIGKALCASRDVRVLSFTGSTAVGRLLAAQSAPTLKRLSMELGGNAPFLVFEDADLDAAVTHLMANKFRCAGQTCVCTNRVLVARPVHDAFVNRLAGEVAALEVGAGSVEGTQVGPLIDGRGWQKVQDLVQDALEAGATAVVGGLSDPPCGAAHHFPPTVLTGVTPSMRCSREEIFGPVLAVGVFATEEEAIALANDTEYGLAAYAFSADPERLQRVARAIHFGHVGLNSGVGPTPEAPFGGMCQSGMGREGGLEGILEFVELQTCPTPIG